MYHYSWIGYCPCQRRTYFVILNNGHRGLFFLFRNTIQEYGIFPEVLSLLTQSIPTSGSDIEVTFNQEIVIFFQHIAMVFLSIDI